ncbi:hypothetical protein [Synechococcus sp. SYN20]|uniref:hypothetical protein n=1 Tax=Synechococcus sp. SYN20 TaxID=1050714 RepID=UPI0016452399|nr:hypothetical protein [Synechococcus sp. SYN20]
MTSTASRLDPRAMRWQTNGELNQGDLIELVCHLRNVECDQHSDELSRLGQSHTEDNQTGKIPQKQAA